MGATTEIRPKIEMDSNGDSKRKNGSVKDRD